MITTPSSAPVPDSLDDALRDLVADGTLTSEQATRVATRVGAPPLGAPPSSPPAATAQVPAAATGRLAELAGYAGAALLVGAVGLFLRTGWQDLSDPSRVVLLAVATAMLAAAGAAIATAGTGSVRELARRHDSARRRLVSTLWAGAAATAAAGAGLLAAAGHEMLAASITAVVVTVSGYALVPGAVGQLGAFVASLGLVGALVDEVGEQPGTITAYAVVYVLLGAAWCSLASLRVLQERTVAMAFGAGSALVGAQMLVASGEHAWLGYLLTAAVALAGYAGFALARRWPLLVAGVAGTTLVVPEALGDWTDGSVPASGVLLLAGLTLLGSSAVSLRLHHRG
jgi:hypothetical protein